MNAAALFILIGVVSSGVAHGQALPRPDGPVNDFANVLSSSARTRLETLLKSLEDESSAEVAVVTIGSLGGISIEEYATRLFREWGVGQAALDNGVLVLVVPTEREMRIEVGYGLEPVLPDGLASAIIREDFLPSFREGNFEGGILRGVGRVADIVRRKHILTPAERAALESSNKPSLFGWLLFGTFGLLWLGGVGMSGLLFGEAAKLKLGPQLIFSLVAIGIFVALPIAFFSRSAVVILPTALAVGVWAYKRRSAPILYGSGRSARGSWDWSTAGSSGSGSGSGSSSSGSSSSFGGGSSGGGGASGSW